MELCPCGSDKPYADCCEPVIRGTRNAETPEALMRSRYTAYVKKELDHLYNSLHPSERKDYKKEEGANWAKNLDWQSLEILKTEDGGPEDETGMVEFIARYRKKETPFNHHEIAEFVREDGQWYFKDGHAPKPVQSIRQGPKIGRNDPCPCGSGKKYKKCCGA